MLVKLCPSRIPAADAGEVQTYSHSLVIGRRLPTSKRASMKQEDSKTEDDNSLSSDIDIDVI